MIICNIAPCGNQLCLGQYLEDGTKNPKPYLDPQRTYLFGCLIMMSLHTSLKKGSVFGVKVNPKTLNRKCSALFD